MKLLLIWRIVLFLLVMYGCYTLTNIIFMVNGALSGIREQTAAGKISLTEAYRSTKHSRILVALA